MAILNDLNELMNLRDKLSMASGNGQAIKKAEAILLRLNKKHNIVLRLVFNNSQVLKVREDSPLKIVKECDLKDIAKGFGEPLNLDKFDPNLIEKEFNFYKERNWGQDTHAPVGQGVFGNRDALLQNGNYMEYDILKRSGSGMRQLNSKGVRGVLRFVRNTNNGRVYFTYDHYRCFVLVSSDGNKYLK